MPHLNEYEDDGRRLILQDPERREAFLAEPMLEHFRPCEVDGKPARFHRWVDEDKVLLQMESLIPSDKFEIIRYRFDKEGVAPAYTHIETVRCTFALVEYDDGTVGKVEPEKVKFTDRRVE